MFVHVLHGRHDMVGNSGRLWGLPAAMTTKYPFIVWMVASHFVGAVVGILVFISLFSGC